jgi:hypothetical protein
MNSGASNRIASTPDIHDPESSSFELAALCGPPFFCPGFSVAKDYRVQGDRRIVDSNYEDYRNVICTVSFLSEWAGQTVPIRLTRELRHETSSSFSTAHCRAWFRACLGAILGCGRGVQEPVLRLLREMGRAFAPERIPGQDPRRRRCHGGQKESGECPIDWAPAIPRRLAAMSSRDTYPPPTSSDC